MAENRRISMNLKKNMKVDLDQKYGEEYGNELTLREAYDLTMKILKEHEMPIYDYLYELPRKFSVVYKVQIENK